MPAELSLFVRPPGLSALESSQSPPTPLSALAPVPTIKRKQTSLKNPQANAILERIHAVLGNMLRTSELDMAEMVKASDLEVFLTGAICSTYHIVLKASPGAAIFGQDMLFDIPFL
jgi:hypothetical protein